MRVLLGLTKKTTQEFNDLLQTLRDLGVDPRNVSADLLNRRESQLLKMGLNLLDHPELNLWNQHPATL